MYGVENKEDNEFRVGDVVYITNSTLPSETCYSAIVCSILIDEETHRLGKHYTLMVPTMVDDYMAIRPAIHCFRNPEQYDDCRKVILKQEVAFRKRVQEVKQARLNKIQEEVWLCSPSLADPIALTRVEK